MKLKRRSWHPSHIAGKWQGPDPRSSSYFVLSTVTFFLLPMKTPVDVLSTSQINVQNQIIIFPSQTNWPFIPCFPGSFDNSPSPNLPRNLRGFLEHSVLSPATLLRVKPGFSFEMPKLFPLAYCYCPDSGLLYLSPGPQEFSNLVHPPNHHWASSLFQALCLVMGRLLCTKAKHEPVFMVLCSLMKK
jgi:hypothetical protein